MLRSFASLRMTLAARTGLENTHSRLREIRVSHPGSSVVKPFGEFGGAGYGEGLGRRFVDGGGGGGAAWGWGGGRNGAHRFPPRENGGRPGRMGATGARWGG